MKGLEQLRAKATWVMHSPYKWTIPALLLMLVTVGCIKREEITQVYLTEPGITNLRVKDAKPDPLIIRFSSSTAKLNQIGKVVNQGISISPEIAGQWHWSSDTQLTFTPSEPWAIAQTYSVNIAKSLIPGHVKLNTYSPSFTTAGFSAELLNVELYQDPDKPKIKRFVATVRFTHKVDQEDFAKQVKLIRRNTGKDEKPDPKPFPFTIEYDETGTEAYIKSDTVTIPLQEQEFALTIDGDARSLRGGVEIGDELTATVRIPGMYSYFRVVESSATLVRNEYNEPEQVLVMVLTDSVHESVLHNYIEVYELPKDKPALQGQKAVKDYRWSNVAAIGPEVLAQSRQLQLQFLPTEHEFSKIHSMRYDARPGHYLYVKLKKGIESAGGYILAKDFETLRRVPDYPRELEIMSKGGVLSLSGDKKLSVVSRGNEAVMFEIGRVEPGQIQHLISQTSGDFQDPYFNNYYFDQDNITQRRTQLRRLQKLPPGKSQYTSIDLEPYLHKGQYRNGVFFVRVQSWDTKNDRPTGVSDKRLVLVTDLGMVVKQNADESHQLFLMSISSGQPVAGAKVMVLGKNGVPVFSSTTNGGGAATIPKLSDYQREREPTAFVVTYNGDMSFMPYNRYDRRLDLSRFDIGGVYQGGKKDSLSAFMFSDRGIYRPGDTFNIGMIIKSADWKRGLQGIPMQVVVQDPRGLTVKSEKFSLSSSGFEELNYTTQASSPTGEYHIKLYLVKDKDERSLLGSETVKVEEFLPDRMKISAVFSKERVMGWVSPQALDARINLKNLYGTPATQRRVMAMISLSPSQPVFGKYRDYHFHDPAKTDKSFSERLPETQTDDAGEAVIPLNLERFDAASYEVTLSVNGYEAEGGRSVSTERSVLVSPREYLVGYKPDGNLGYVSKGSERKVHLIAINPKLEPMALDKLQLELLELRYVSVLMKQDNGTYKYQSVQKQISLGKTNFSIAAKGSDYKLPSDNPGDYRVIIRDASGLELNHFDFSVAGAGELSRELEKNAELQIRLDSKDYKAGDLVQVHIKAPYTGAGLITIERDQVYAYKWFKTSSTSSVQSIRVPAGLEGNAYINVSFVRALDSKEIFMSPLSYGVVPFTINRESRRNQISLDVPYLIRPGDEVAIKYNTSRSGKIVVYAVNEGILQVANYKTPRPLSHFFTKRALEVNTLQILDLLLPEFSVAQALKAEGGGLAREAMSSNLNPFARKRAKPVVFWSGIIDAKPGGGVVKYRVPDYFNGSLRFMAVAVSADTVGATAKKSLVRGHFVLSPNVPTFVAPGDEFTVSVNVANNVEESGDNAKVKIKLKTSEHLELLGQTDHELVIGEGREKSLTFKVRAKQGMLGSANFSFSASLGDKQSKASVDLSVRPAIPYITDVSGGMVRDDDVTVEYQRQMYPEFRTRKLSLSPIPLGLSRGLLDYLENYPYACTEQLVSRVFPMVMLKGRAELGYEQSKAEDSVARTLYILRSRQNSEGAFGFWAANSHVSPYQSVYTIHFLMEARDAGFAIPEDMLASGRRYLTTMAQQSVAEMSDARVRAYAIYLLTREGVVTTRYLNELREVLEKNHKKSWRRDISRAYMAATYQLLQLDKEAAKLIDDVRMGTEADYQYRYFYDSLSHRSQLLYLLAKHFPQRLEVVTGEDLEGLAAAINGGFFNTLSSSQVIMALDAYAEAVGDSSQLKVTVTALQEKQEQVLPIPGGLYPELSIDAQYPRVKIDNGQETPLFYQQTEAGFDTELPSKEVKEGIEIQREYRNADGDVVSEATLGEELTVHVKLRAVDGKTHFNVAVVDLLPGGFEVVLDASREAGGDWQPQYVDLREDRVLLFGTVGEDAQEFVYTIKATNKGLYVVPPPFAEGMYQRTIRARGRGEKIQVK